MDAGFMNDENNIPRINPTESFCLNFNRECTFLS